MILTLASLIVAGRTAPVVYAMATPPRTPSPTPYGDELRRRRGY